MKNIAIISFLSVLFIFTACNNTNGSKTEGSPSENTEGVVVQMSSDMFKKLVWDYEKNPNEFKFNGDLPVVIDFYATWCRPCKMVAPIMEDLAKEYKGKIRIYKIDTDQESELSRVFNIRSIPAILYVPKTGQPQMSVGMSDKDTYMKTIQDVLLGGISKQ